jgi:hypothetical protein
MLDSTFDEDEDEDEDKTSRAVLLAEERWDQRVLQDVRLEALMKLSEITDIHVLFWCSLCDFIPQIQPTRFPSSPYLHTSPPLPKSA